MLTDAANKKVFSPLGAARRQKGPIHNKLVLTLPHPHLQTSYQPWVGQKGGGKFCDLRTARKYRAAPCLHPQPCLNAQALETLKKGRLPSGFI